MIDRADVLIMAQVRGYRVHDMIVYSSVDAGGMYTTGQATAGLMDARLENSWIAQASTESERLLWIVPL